MSKDIKILQKGQIVLAYERQTDSHTGNGRLITYLGGPDHLATNQCRSLSWEMKFDYQGSLYREIGTRTNQQATWGKIDNLSLMFWKGRSKQGEDLLVHAVDIPMIAFFFSLLRHLEFYQMVGCARPLKKNGREGLQIKSKRTDPHSTFIGED